MENSILAEQAQVLIGKNIIANGWQRDNSGSLFGVITSVYQRGNYDQFYITVDPENSLSMDDMLFDKSHLEVLLRDGKLPEANKLLNSGTNAKIV